MKYIDSGVFEYKNGLNVKRYMFAVVKEVLLIIFIASFLFLLARGDVFFSGFYESFMYEYDCENYVRYELYPKYQYKDYMTVEGFIELHMYGDGVCENNILFYQVVICVIFLFLLLYLFISKGVSFRCDKKRRIIYTVSNWRLLVYRLPRNVEDIEFRFSDSNSKEPFLLLPMTRISNGKEVQQALGVPLANRNDQNPMIIQAVKMYFSKANENSDDQWIKNTIEQSNGLRSSFLYKVMIRPLYFSLFKEASLDDPKLLAKVDAYLEKNPPNPAKDDLYKDFDFYNQE